MTSTRKTILMIEDDQLSANFMAELIDSMGGDEFRTRHADTLAGGLQTLTAEDINLVLLDLDLPDSSGLETMERINNVAPNVAVIILTGLSGAAIASTAIHLGAQDYLVKGQVDGKMLMQTIRYSIERKRFQEELQKTHVQMMHHEKMASIGQLAAGIAHEINNPIGFISCNLGSLNKYVARLTEFINFVDASLARSDETTRKEVEDKRQALKVDLILNDTNDLIKESLQGTSRAKKIVQDLLSFARTDQDENRLVNLNDIIESTIDMVWNELKYKVTLKKELAPLPMTRCNPQQLSQVFVNLLLNAAQAIATQGEITVKTWVSKHAVHVTISDTGSGIPAQFLTRIFEPFFTTKDVGQGTGLGLSIAYEIVSTKHHGEITVSSEEGRGTTFSVRIPLAQEQPDQTANHPNTLMGRP